MEMADSELGKRATSLAENAAGSFSNGMRLLQHSININTNSNNNKIAAVMVITIIITTIKQTLIVSSTNDAMASTSRQVWVAKVSHASCLAVDSIQDTTLHNIKSHCSGSRLVGIPSTLWRKICQWVFGGQ